MSAAPAPTTTLSFVNTSGLYCPACEEPYVPAPPHHPPVLLSPCGLSVCAACFDALPAPSKCLVCNQDVKTHVLNTALVELAAEVIGSGRSAGVGSEQVPSLPESARVGEQCAQCGCRGDELINYGESTSEVVVADGRGSRKRSSTEVCPSSARSSKKASFAEAPAPSSSAVVPSIGMMHCNLHNAVLCGRCAAEEHAAPGCDVRAAADAASLIRQRAAAHARKCATAASTTYRSAILRVGGALESLKQQHTACRERVEAGFSEIVAGLEAHRVRVLGQLNDVYRERAKSLEATLDRLIVSVSQLEACVAAEARSAAGIADLDVVKATELESLCAGMSALADAYVGVDVSPCIGVSMDAGSVLASLEKCAIVNTHDVSVDRCVVYGPGLREPSGVPVDSSGEAVVEHDHTFTLRCADANGEPLHWVTPDDVAVTVSLPGSVAPQLSCSARAAGLSSSSSSCESTDDASAAGGMFAITYAMPNCIVGGSAASDAGDVGSQHTSSCSAAGDVHSVAAKANAAPNILKCHSNYGSAALSNLIRKTMAITVTVCGVVLRGFPLKLGDTYKQLRAHLNEPISCANVMELLKALEGCVSVAEVQLAGFDVLIDYLPGLSPSLINISEVLHGISKHVTTLLVGYSVTPFDTSGVVCACLRTLNLVVGTGIALRGEMLQTLGPANDLFVALITCAPALLHRLEEPAQQALLLQYCTILRELTVSDLRQESFVAAGGMSVLVTLLTHCVGKKLDIGVASLCCEIAMSCTFTLSKENTAVLLSLGLVPLVISAMEMVLGSPENVIHCTTFLVNVASWCARYEMAPTDLSQDALFKVFRCMDAHPHNAELQLDCCLVIGNIARSRLSEECLGIVHADACARRVVRALGVKGFSGRDMELRFRACEVLNLLATHWPSCVACIRDEGGMELIAAAGAEYGIRLDGLDVKLLRLLDL